MPDRTEAILGIGPSPLPALVAGARRLRRMGARVVATPCNTAHRYLPEVSRLARVQVIDMVEATMSRVASAGASRVGLLGTRGTRAAGLYEAAGERHAITVVQPTENAQGQFVDRAIRLVKDGRALGHAELLITRAATELRNAGVDVIIAACTEIPLVMRGAAEVTEMVDSLDCLARACVRELRPSNGASRAA